eukprot:9231548-Pyramimonas_sp.AAC.2
MWFSPQHSAHSFYLAWRRTQPYAVVTIALVEIVFGGAPHGPRNAVLRGGDACGKCHWAFGGSPYGATKRSTAW